MQLVCSACKNSYKANRLFICPDCGSILTVNYSYGTINGKKFIDQRQSKIWRFWRLFPFEHFPRNFITLGEGDTPLLRARVLGKEFGITNLYLKNEGENPTGSFKDRSIAVGFNKALQEGAKKVMVYSSGNAAVSLASFAHKARIQAKVFIESTNKTAIDRCRNLGVKVIGVPDEKTFLRDLRLLFFLFFKNWENAWQKEFLSFFENEFRNGWYPIQPNIIVNPYQIEGIKTISYEICEQLKWDAPDVVISAGITGDLFLGQWRGYKDLYHLKLIRHLPRMILIARKKKHPFSIFNSLVLKVIRDSGGEIVYTTEEENKEAMKLIFNKENIETETISASVIAGLRRVKQNLKTNSKIICILSGNNV